MSAATSYQSQPFPSNQTCDSMYSYASQHGIPSTILSNSSKQPVFGPYSNSSLQISQPPKSSTAEPTATVPQQNTRSRPGSRSSEEGSALSKMDDSRRRNAVIPSLQIPPSINKSGGSIGEFAAQITCLFWFESTSIVELAEKWTDNGLYSPITRLVSDAIPSIGFRKWVVTIITTTAVTPNVVLLALLFIYRLKSMNAKVNGKLGSEYRLLTVALMLGNKFLDDNTYTNKTWAEVSGISVSEIHVMEVEFLSNMRYTLFVSQEQWIEWQAKLSRFSSYYDKAAVAPARIPSPVIQVPHTYAPSPSPMASSPPFLPTYSPTAAAFNFNQPWTTGYVPPLVSPLGPLSDSTPELNLLPNSRKRSYDEGVDEPPAKRITRSAVSQMASNPPSSQRNNIPRLPLPNLSVSTQVNGYQSNYQHPNSTILPPLGSRAMSTVYPTPPYQNPHGSVTPTGAPNHIASHGTNGSISYGTPSRRHSPRAIQDLLSMNSSPVSGIFPHHNSPSFYMQQRSSPYRPVRPPNTLLHAPPSASMHVLPPSIGQMHYQPLGKRNEYRSGLVPEYLHPASQTWLNLPPPQTYQS